VAEKRISNLLVFSGRAAVAAIIGFLAVLCLVPMNIWCAAVGLFIALCDALAWRWALSSPVWIEVSSEKVCVRYLYRSNEYQWKDLKVFIVSETTNTRGIRVGHCFANFRTNSGEWFKVRIGSADFSEFENLIPDASRGKAILRHVETGPQPR
jgi:hypothetical protein